MATDPKAPSDQGRDQAPDQSEAESPEQRQSGDYEHQDPAVQRPAVGVQEDFPDPRPPKEYRYDSSLAPELCWDENGERAFGEWLLDLIERGAAQGEAAVFTPGPTWAGTAERFQSMAECVARLKSLTRPFLNWSGKAERQRIRVPTIPLFVHERQSTQAILSTLEGYKAIGTTGDLFGDPRLDVSDQLDAYDHVGPWSNRLVLGDSLQVMNSLLEYEGLGGQVQMIYMDPPYGVKFGSNFQPFVRKRDVKHGQDEDMIREPEMVKAYRDTWELGLHSYLTVIRDRLLFAKELLTESGSIFVQISDQNLHHVTEVLDEVFGPDNRTALIAFKKTGFASSEALSTTHDFILWYAKARDRQKVIPIFGDRELTKKELDYHDHIELSNGTRRVLTKEEKKLGSKVREIGRVFARNPMVSPGWQDSLGYPISFSGMKYRPPANRHWATRADGMERLREKNPRRYLDRMIEVLRKSHTLRLPGNLSLSLANVRALSGGDHEQLHAEAVEQPGSDQASAQDQGATQSAASPEGARYTSPGQRPGVGARTDPALKGRDMAGRRIAIVFGPEDGAIDSQQVYDAAREAYFLKFDALYLFGFAIQAKARELVADRKKLRLPCVYVAVTPDVVMSDLLKTSKSSEVFSVTGLPDVRVSPAGGAPTGAHLYRVKLLGLDIFRPHDMETESIAADNLPCWMLDTDYNGMVFMARQVFFPKTSAWDNLEKSLRGRFAEGVWAHLAGTESEPFAAGAYRQIAVKVIDERGNELMVVKPLGA